MTTVAIPDLEAERAFVAAQLAEMPTAAMLTCSSFEARLRNIESRLSNAMVECVAALIAYKGSG
jgi:hypothetical protein